MAAGAAVSPVTGDSAQHAPRRCLLSLWPPGLLGANMSQTAPACSRAYLHTRAIHFRCARMITLSSRMINGAVCELLQGQTGSPPQQFLKGEKQIYSGWSSKGWRNLWNRAHSRTISPGSLFKGEDNKCILVCHRAKWGDIVCNPAVAGVKSHTATETFSPQIKVNAIASVLKSGQNLVIFILLLKLVKVILQLMRVLKTKNDNKRRSQRFFLPICHQKHLEVSEVPAPPLVFTNFRRSRHYVTPVSASRSEP